MEDTIKTTAVQDEDATKKLLKHPDENALSIINSMTGESYTAEDIWTCRLRVVEEETDRMFDEPTPEFIKQFAEKVIGKRATFDHDLTDASKQWGVVYSAAEKVYFQISGPDRHKGHHSGSDEPPER